MGTWKQKLHFQLRDILVNSRNRKRLVNKDFSIFSNDCLGGVICKDLKVRMDSPTRNLFFSAQDYIKFLTDPEYYLSLEMKETEDTSVSYPCAMLGDLKLYLVHYPSFQEAHDKWEIRKQRLHFDNLYVLMDDRNGCTEEHIKAFEALPYKHKVFLSHIPYPQYPSVVYIKGSESDPYLKVVTDYTRRFTMERYYDRFDFVSWLNQK